MRSIVANTFIITGIVVSLFSSQGISVATGISDYDKQSTEIIQESSKVYGDIKKSETVVNRIDCLKVTVLEDKGYMKVVVDEKFNKMKSDPSDEIVLRLSPGISGDPYNKSVGLNRIVKAEELGTELILPILTSEFELLPEEKRVINVSIGFVNHDASKSKWVIFSESISFDIPTSDEFNDSKYLSSTSFVNFNESSMVTKFAKIVKDISESNEQFIVITFDMLSSFIEYDYDLMKDDKIRFHVPDPDKTIETSKGVCSDYAVTLAANLRSQGVPTKVVAGKSSISGEGHMWNEILINGVWVPVDPTAGKFYLNSEYVKEFSY